MRSFSGQGESEKSWPGFVSIVNPESAQSTNLRAAQGKRIIGSFD
jgi:hypothetical protein